MNATTVLKVLVCHTSPCTDKEQPTSDTSLEEAQPFPPYMKDYMVMLASHTGRAHLIWV